MRHKDVTEPESPEQPGAPPSFTPPLRGRILVVEDDALQRTLLVRPLAARGYPVDEADSVGDARQALEREVPDLVILDIVMPDGSGLELLASIREKYSMTQLPVIIATARDDHQDVVHALELGANDYVTKPVNVRVMLARVRTQMQLKRLSDAKDAFLSMASHDLKSTVGVVRRAASMMLSGLPVGAPMTTQYRDLLQHVETTARHMSTLIEDFLSLQALDTGTLRLRPALTDLNQMAEEVVAVNTAPARAKRVLLATDLDAAVRPVMVDGRRIQQVVQNLVDNAIKFAPPGCEVSVRTIAVEQGVRVEVCDSGPGLPPEEIARAFSRNAGLSNRPTGGESSTGLGLPICKQLVELQGGRIGLIRNPYQGLTFWFELPLGAARSEVMSTRDI